MQSRASGSNASICCYPYMRMAGQMSHAVLCPLCRAGLAGTMQPVGPAFYVGSPNQSCHAMLCCARCAEQDRRERRRQQGKPEELTEEEKEAERQKEAAKQAQESKRKLPVRPISGLGDRGLEEEGREEGGEEGGRDRWEGGVCGGGWAGGGEDVGQAE